MGPKKAPVRLSMYYFLQSILWDPVMQLLVLREKGRNHDETLCYSFIFDSWHLGFDRGLGSTETCKEVAQALFPGCHSCGVQENFLFPSLPQCCWEGFQFVGERRIWSSSHSVFYTEEGQEHCSGDYSKPVLLREHFLWQKLKNIGVRLPDMLFLQTMMCCGSGCLDMAMTLDWATVLICGGVGAHPATRCSFYYRYTHMLCEELVTLGLGFWPLLLSSASISSRFSCPVYWKEERKKSLFALGCHRPPCLGWSCWQTDVCEYWVLCNKCSSLVVCRSSQVIWVSCIMTAIR